MNTDGTDVVQITNSAGFNVGASQGVVKVTGRPGK
jgi:hypothetical protein